MQRRIILSPFTNIFWNLALEDWCYKNLSLDKYTLILLWINESCVVIGRHQNPFKEVNIRELENRKIPLARRNSGGGTVYHDVGNLNFTFLTRREDYCRRVNLEFIKNILETNFGFKKLTINSKDDLLYDGFKVSGSAAKLSRYNAYHHFTLLINTDLQFIRKIFKPTVFQNCIDTKATNSTRSEVVNLSEIDGSFGIDKLIAFFQPEPIGNLVNLLEIDNDIKNQCMLLNNWNWIYGRTPDFRIKFDTITIEVKNGIIVQIDYHLVQPEWIRNLIGMKFDDLIVNDFRSFPEFKRCFHELDSGSRVL